MELTANSNTGNTGVTTLNVIADLRKFEPTSAAQIAVVMEYNAGTKTGGGIFVYDADDKTTPEDFGVTIVTAKGARWKRNVDNLRNLTVLAFGAIEGGKVDTAEAVMHMWKWSQKYNPNIGIQFPAGRFLISHFDISKSETAHFRLAGDNVTFGYSPATTLVSDKKNGEVMFSVMSRYTEINSLVIDGESTDSAKNNKGFYINSIQAGQFIRISNIMFHNLGGKAISMLDTLDCKIDQWYASHCSDSVIHATWSNNPQGKWDHITAIELSNFNIQYSTGKPAIDLQRATQSLIWNGWIEHTEFPGNLSNGSWSFRGFNIEDCSNPMQCHYTRIINIQFNLQGENGLDLSESGDTWDTISLYEHGDVHIENHGITIDGSLDYDYLSSQNKMDNRTDKEKWFYVGELKPSQNTVQTKLRIIGSASFNSQGETQTDYSTRTPEGSAEIYLQKINDTDYIGSWKGEGASPLTRVLFQPGSTAQSIKIYVKVAMYTGYCSAFVETNDYNRFSHGVRFIFDKAYTEVTDNAELKKLEELPDNCFHQHWSGKSGVGIGFNNDNVLLLKSVEVTAAELGTSSKYLKVFVDGKAYGLELKALK